jgi:CheY-like chemotaxis protein
MLADGGYIVVVDANPDARRFVTNFLENQDVPANGASSRSEMYRYFEMTTPSLIILDLQLERDDGLDVLRELRSRSDVPVVVITKNPVEEIDRTLYLELGADDCLTKPFSLRELLARIHAILRRHKPGRTTRDRSLEDIASKVGELNDSSAPFTIQFACPSGWPNGSTRFCWRFSKSNSATRRSIRVYEVGPGTRGSIAPARVMSLRVCLRHSEPICVGFPLLIHVTAQLLSTIGETESLAMTRPINAAAVRESLQRLFRDSVGIKPLFYQFDSEPKAILAHPAVQARQMLVLASPEATVEAKEHDHDLPTIISTVTGLLMSSKSNRSSRTCRSVP